MICELIAAACLAAHGEISGTHRKPIQSAYQADRIIKALEALHPNFYPIPTRYLKTDGDVVSIATVKVEHQKLYKECAENLHRGSMKSLGAKRTSEAQWRKIRQWHFKIERLLFPQHRIVLLKGNRVLWVKIEDDGDVSASLMEGI